MICLGSVFVVLLVFILIAVILSAFCCNENRLNWIHTKLPGEARPGTVSFADAASLNVHSLDVDVVYTWVNPEDAQWKLRKRRRLIEATTLPTNDDLDEGRYRHFDELRYSIRSLFQFAPWVRKVFLVTDQQVPDWLDIESAKSLYRLHIVDHRDIFPDDSCLPTFNSIAIETCLHRIPQLSETFLYMNDDVFFAKPVEKHHFFTYDFAASKPGVKLYYDQRFALDSDFVEQWSRKANMNGFDYGMKNCWTTLLQSKPQTVKYAYIPQHAPFSCLKSQLANIERLHAEQIDRTRRSPARGSVSTNFINGLWFHLASQSFPRAVYVDPEQANSAFFTCDTYLHNNGRLSDRDLFFCINECNIDRLQQENKLGLLEQLLEKNCGGKLTRLACEKSCSHHGRDSAEDADDTAERS